MSAAVLLAVICKTGLVAALALAGAALLRARPARERVALLRLGLILVAALPLISQQVPALRIETPAALSRPAAAPAAQPAPVLARPAVEAPADAAVAAVAPPSPPSATPAFRPWILLAAIYAIGAGFLLLRLALGVAGLVRRTREARPVEDARWLAALERAAGTGRSPQLKVSPRPLAPLSWGLRPGVVLIGPDALAQPERADAVLTHELAHIRHGDWPFLMLSRLLVAAFWFNPLVWLLERELTRQSEHAADAWAVARVPRLDYAGALVAMARSGRPHAALGMADSELAKRVKTVLDGRAFGGRPWPTAVAAVACVGFAGPLAALELAPAALPPILRPTAAPAPVATPAPSEAAANRLVRALTAPAPDKVSAEDLTTVVRQRDQGLAMMEGGAREMEATAAQMRRNADILPLTEAERAQMLSEASQLNTEASELRRQASELAARDPATLRPMSPDDERELAANLTEASAAMTIAVDVDANLSSPAHPGPSADVQVNLGRGEAATARGLAATAVGRAAEDAAEARREAARTQGEADRLARNRPPPPPSAQSPPPAPHPSAAPPAA